VRLSTRRNKPPIPRSAFAGFRFPAEVITVAVRWYLRYGLSYRDVEELLAERGVESSLQRSPSSRICAVATAKSETTRIPCGSPPHSPSSKKVI
jgi:hypothetical protein